MSTRDASFAPSRGGIAATLVFAMLLCLGCQKSNDAQPKNNVAAPAVMEPDWSPAPMALPTPPTYRPTEDADMRTAQGASWPGAGPPVGLLKFNLTGDRVFVTLANGTCHVLDPKTGESHQHWNTGKSDKVVEMEIAIDDKRVVLRHANDDNLYVRDTLDGTLLRTIDSPKAKITAFALAADPRLLAIGTDAGVLQIHDIVDGKVLQEQRISSDGAAITAIAFSNDCQHVFAAWAGNSSIGVFQLPQLNLETSIEQPCGTPIRLISTWTGNYLMVLCEDNVAELFLLKQGDYPTAKVYGRYGATAIHHGKPENWFLLPECSRLCCYLGGEAYEYYNLFNIGIAGSQSTQTQEEPQPVVGLAPDGKQAATAFPDGTVRFYSLPGPGKTAFMRNTDFGKQLYGFLKAGNYDELDQLAQQALTETQSSITIWSRAELLSYYLGNLTTAPSQEAWDTHLAQLQKWLDAKPESRAARLVVAVATKNYAWYLRGDRIAGRTEPEAFRVFYEQLLKADVLLKAADEGTPSAPICAECITIAMGLQKGQEELTRIWKRGVEGSGAYSPLHSNLAYALLPRWGGGMGDVGRMANRAYEELSEEDRDIAYAAMAMLYVRIEPVIQLGVTGFDLDKLDGAIENVIKRCPEADGMLNLATIVACLRGDHAAAEARISRAAGNYDRELWRKPEIFDKFRHWAQQKQVSDGAERLLLTSWNALRQIAFADNPDELITLSNDFALPVHTWDLNDVRSHQAISLPGFVPWFMSRATGWIVGQVGQQPQVMMFDRTTGRSYLRDDIDPQRYLCISGDEQQMAAYDRSGHITIYDLQNNSRKPLHTLELELTPVAVDFPSDQKVWSIAIADDDGKLRLVSEKGKDLNPPIKLASVAQRLLSIPGGSRLLVAGEGMLAVVDMASGKIQSLSDEQSSNRSPSFYSAIAVNGDGTLAAAGRVDSQSQVAGRPREIVVWDLKQGSKVRVLAANDEQIDTLAFSGDSKRLASGNALGFVQIWNLELRGE